MGSLAIGGHSGNGANGKIRRQAKTGTNIPGTLAFASCPCSGALAPACPGRNRHAWANACTVRPYACAAPIQLQFADQPVEVFVP